MCLLSLVSGISFSEDIELYISEEVRRGGKRPQVLIILDNSGSMTTEINSKDGYKPSTTYPALQEDDNALKDSFTYFVYGGVDGARTDVPAKHNQARRFVNNNNSCATAIELMNKHGYYTGAVLEYNDNGNNSNTWGLIPDNNGANPDLVDCYDDIANKYPANASISQSGYPINNSSSSHTSDIDNSTNVAWGGSMMTLYTANYLRWYHNETADGNLRPKIDIAIEAISSVINTTPSVDFGLELYNRNDGDGANDGNGGRIVYGIKTMNATNKTELLDIINNQVVANTNTPLCESLYEASQYFSGKTIDYGNDDTSVNGYTGNTPPADTTIVDVNNNYKPPFKDCSSMAFVILISDGAPIFDNAADSKIEDLTVVEKGDTVKFSGAKVDGNYLAGLAEWMFKHDINANLDGIQNVTTYTIGFGDSVASTEPLLKAAASLGGGQYRSAGDASTLGGVISGFIASLDPSNNSLTSASVAANNFDRTETLNSVYYAMFDPQEEPRWQGNIKKYKVKNHKQLGKNGKDALSNTTGHFNKDVTSYWSSDVDGDDISKGGVAEMLRAKTNRVIWSDIGIDNKLELLTTAQIEAGASFGDKAALAIELDVPEDDIQDYMSWAQGKNIDNVKLDDGTIPTMRPDVFGDPLHSKPLVVNYGTSVRILVGTNSGALHMFKDSVAVDTETDDETHSVDETWAFMPKEFFYKYKALRINDSSMSKIYGIDGEITAHITDGNGDGIVNGSDTVWIFFGLRRGGTSYYGVDITKPAAPALLWHIKRGDTGFEKLAQTWSKPKIGFSKINISSGVAKPVLFFGGGYDPVKDAAGSPAADASDTYGKAIYMVDAESGKLKWSLAAGGTTAFLGTDSIPASIGMLDSDGDGLTDRLYAGDTGGNVWRVDMPSDNPKHADNPWTAFKLASVGGTTDATDRRFFNEPSIVRTFISETIETSIPGEKNETSYQEVPYDAVLLGSGDRSNPLGTDTSDTFYMFKDKHVQTQSFSSGSTPATPTALVVGDLYNYTDNPFSKNFLTQEERQTLEIAVSKKSGWYVDYGLSGEKTSAEALVINGVAYFTSYSPPVYNTSGTSCDVPNGLGWLYAVDLALGVKKYNWVDSENYDNSVDDGDERKILISEQFLGAPTLIVVPDDTDKKKKDIGDIIVGRTIVPVGFSLQTLRTHLYITEDQ